MNNIPRDSANHNIDSPPKKNITTSAQQVARFGHIIHRDDIRPCDVICGRGSYTIDNIGNREFRSSIRSNLQSHERARGRADKGEVIRSIVRLLVDEFGTRFMKPTKDGTGSFIEMNELQACRKVSHALRDMSVQVKAQTPEDIAKKKKAMEDEFELEPVQLVARSLALGTVAGGLTPIQIPTQLNILVGMKRE